MAQDKYTRAKDEREQRHEVKGGHIHTTTHSKATEQVLNQEAIEKTKDTIKTGKSRQEGTCIKFDGGFDYLIEYQPHAESPISI